jgi:hypothetical protein
MLQPLVQIARFQLPGAVTFPVPEGGFLSWQKRMPSSPIHRELEAISICQIAYQAVFGCCASPHGGEKKRPKNGPDHSHSGQIGVGTNHETGFQERTR